MYIVLVYDVAQERVAKVCKMLRRRLTWVQNSVFEGEITEAGFREIQASLSDVIDGDRDSVLFYCISNPHYYEKRVMGQEKAPTDCFL